MKAFDYHIAADLDDAAQRLSEDEGAQLLAGGMTLVPSMKQRLATPASLIDLSRLNDLVGICVDGERLVIGAMTTHATVAASDVVRNKTPALAELAEGIGHPQIRHRATLGGAIANNDPAADYTAALLGLDAVVMTNRRRINAEQFFTASFDTALERGEIITAVEFPVCAEAAYRKFSSQASHYAMAGVFVARLADGVRVAVTGAAPLVYRESVMERALEASFDADAVVHLTLDVAGFREDIHGSAEYRGQLVRVMAARAVAAAAARNQ